MKLIDNLEELKVGDFIRYNEDEEFIFICKIILSNKQIIKVQEFESYGFNAEYKYHREIHPEDKIWEIPKKIKRTKKKKLKHKLVTYNDDYIIFKLTEKEKKEIIREKILKNLEQ